MRCGQSTSFFKVMQEGCRGNGCWMSSISWHIPDRPQTEDLFKDNERYFSMTKMIQMIWLGKLDVFKPNLGWHLALLKIAAKNNAQSYH